MDRKSMSVAMKGFIKRLVLIDCVTVCGFVVCIEFYGELQVSDIIIIMTLNMGR